MSREFCYRKECPHYRSLNTISTYHSLVMLPTNHHLKEDAMYVRLCWYCGHPMTTTYSFMDEDDDIIFAKNWDTFKRIVRSNT